MRNLREELDVMLNWNDGTKRFHGKERLLLQATYALMIGAAKYPFLYILYIFNHLVNHAQA
jgi:hypothetical protein